MSYSDIDKWNLLQETPPKGDALTVRPAFPGISKQLLAGIDSDGNRHFLIPLSPEDGELNDNQSRGIHIACRDLQVKNQTQDLHPARYMDLICQDVAGYEAFDTVGREISVSLDAGAISKSELVRNILAKWRRFWGQPPKNLLSHEEIVGLFAELWFLHRWILPYMDAIIAVSGWRGPYGSRHDFEWPNQSVEVKGTISSRGRTHWIHGLEQLSSPQDGELLFFSLRLRQEGGATNTLPSLINSCRTALSNEAEALTNFENSLAMIGYSPLHDTEYEKICLRVVDEQLYSVQDTFPRITTSTFKDGRPAGVEAVQYEINLAGHENLIVARAPGKKPF